MAAFQWPLGKLELINSALSQTGDNLVAVADDGSEEWMACSPAYERGLAFVTEDHPWAWATGWRTLVPSPTAPTDTQFDTAYPIPADMVHLIMVRMLDRPCAWDMIDDMIVVNAKGGPPPPSVPTVPLKVTVKAIFSTNSDISNGTPAVVLALQHYVMAGIYRGLHKDPAEAGRMTAFANQILEHAKSRHDMQKPKRALFNSRVTMARRVRRPWIGVTRGWGGTGSPGQG